MKQTKAVTANPVWKDIPDDANKFTFRYNNWEDYTYPEGTYERLIEWCGMYEIEIKYIGKRAGKRCRWLEITVGLFMALFIRDNMPQLQLHKAYKSK